MRPFFFGHHSPWDILPDSLCQRRYDEIRNSYRSAILHSHPDKLNGCSSDEKFLKIQKAWQVLSDAELRVVYDNDLRSSRLDGVTADELIQNCLVQLWKFSGKLFDFCTHLC
ncbi:hypothetical protein F2Q69_00022468 [Brassica cretica]|uniref:J domain-containing protein n=1 Tax=Brassica cretica TaxID=69181 RepID=A0A8S9QI01_BRACR|nr:hypothetical protein F2Q69_00022468 [Brassica cretica]